MAEVIPHRSAYAGAVMTEPVDILLVDDRPQNLLSLEAALEDLNQNLVTAASGSEALRALLDREYAVILLDVMMPEMDGYETAALIRQRAQSRHTPIIFLTAIDKNPAHIERGYEVGAADYLFKPIDPHILRAKVQVFIELHRHRRAAETFSAALEERVRVRTAELEAANRRLQQEIADRKRAEAEVRTLNAELEERVRARTAELEATNEELTAFSYSVSHDLRAPLRKLNAFSQFLLDDYAAELDEPAQDYLQRIQAASEHMNALVSDLLKLSRVVRVPFTHEPLDLSALAADVVEELRLSHPGHEPEVRIEAGVHAEGDARLLRIVLQNLLDNAWKFTGQAEAPCIAFGMEPDEDGQPVYYVRDNGAGFEMEHADKLFHPFQRLHAPSEFPGTGIGLAIVQRVIRRHGGNIWAEAAEGEGAAFYFTLQPSEAASDDA